MESGRNHWATTTSALATWRMHLPAAGDDAAVERIVDLVAALLHAGRESEMFDVERTGLRIDDLCAAWRGGLRETGELPVLQTPPSFERLLRGSTLLAHYDAAGTMQETWTTQAGSLLRDLVGKDGDFTKRDAPAVRFGRSFRVAKGEPATLDVELHTDAMFPVVADLVAPNGLVKPPPAVDNRELAARNAPRMNRLLAAARAAAEAAGARWELVDRDGKNKSYGYHAIRKHYARFLTESAVLAEPAPTPAKKH